MDAEPGVHHVAGQHRRVEPPDGKYWPDAGGAELLLAVAADVLEEQIAAS